jgi:peptidoglycan/xylan/chitin deacetylase (PgdA/CDA1 family)
LSVGELVQFLEGTRDVPHRSVVLAFDDGPRNFYDVAFPLLKEFNAKAVAFIAPGLHADSAMGDDVEARPMTWQEIQTIRASGLVEFQSHTLESRFVPQWPLPAALAGCDPAIEAPRRGPSLPFKEDLAASVRVLQERLPETNVEQLAFPMYVGSEAAVSSARQLGFKACHWGIVRGRALNRRGDSPFHICRISDEFLRRLPGEGRVSWLHIVRERLHRARLGRAWRKRYGELPV